MPGNAKGVPFRGRARAAQAIEGERGGLHPKGPIGPLAVKDQAVQIGRAEIRVGRRSQARPPDLRHHALLPHPPIGNVPVALRL